MVKIELNSEEINWLLYSISKMKENKQVIPIELKELEQKLNIAELKIKNRTRL
ncbi:hypothetical protein [Enterococcus alishanensis]